MRGRGLDFGSTADFALESNYSKGMIFRSADWAERNALWDLIPNVTQA